MNNSTQQHNDNIWDKYYSSYQKGSVIPGIRYPNNLLTQFILDWKNSKAWKKDRKPRVLELGFGTITNLLMMSEFGCKVEGLEVSQETTQRARDAILKLKLDDVITVDSYDGGGIIPKPDNHYDLVVGLQCVYYNLDQSQFASECNRILSSDGLIFFSFFSPRHGYMENIDGLPGGPVRFNEKQPNQRLIGLHPFLYKDRPQFSDIYGEWFDVSVGIEEFDTLPVFQSWYYLRGQKKIASNKTRIDFPLSYPVDEINGVILDKKEYEVAGLFSA